VHWLMVFPSLPAAAPQPQQMQDVGEAEALLMYVVAQEAAKAEAGAERWQQLQPQQCQRVEQR